MAAGDEFPLEVILIIVAVIVVLFIAIFFGGLISTRLRKRKVFKDPSIPAKSIVGVGERSGGGGAGDGGGGASKDDGPPALSQPLPPSIKYNDFMKHNIDKQKLVNIIKAQLYYINNSMFLNFGKDTRGNKTGSKTGSDIRFENFVNLFKHLNLTTEQCDNIRQKIISDIFDKDIPHKDITIKVKDPADSTKTTLKNKKVPDDDEYISLSMVLINTLENLSIKIDLSELYKKTYDYINTTIEILFKSLENIKSGNRKREVVKLINKSEKLTNLYLISPLLKSEYINNNNKQDLLLKNVLWQIISIYDKTITDKKDKKRISPKIAAIFTSSEKTLDNLFSEPTDIVIINKYITEQLITGPWDKMFDYLTKSNTYNMNITALVDYIGFQCYLKQYTTDVSKDVELQRAKLEIQQKNNNKNIKNLLDDAVNVLKPKHVATHIWEHKFKSILNKFVNFVQPLNKIVGFTVNKTDLSKYKTDLDELKTNNLDMLNALTQDDQIDINIVKFANDKYVGYDELLTQLEIAHNAYKQLNDFLIAHDVKINYENADKLYNKGIINNMDSNDLEQNLEDFKQYVQIQSNCSKLAYTLKNIYTVLSSKLKKDIDPKINRVEQYYIKFYELLSKIHDVTKQHHSKYENIMDKLRESLDNSTQIDTNMIDQLSDMQKLHTSATVISTASNDLSQSLNLHNITDQTDKGHILNKSISNIHTEITTTHKSKIDKIVEDIPINLQTQINSITGQIQSETKTLDTSIEEIKEEKDKILEYINRDILADTVSQTDALENIDSVNSRINDLQKEIDQLSRIDPDLFKVIINAANHINPAISVIDLESAIKINNDTHDYAKNIATDCTVAISDGAIKIATDTYDECDKQIKALPNKELNNIIDYITGLISVNPLYAKIGKYVEIAAKIGDTNAEYKDILEKKNNLQSELTKLSKDVNTYILHIFDLSASVTAASDELKSINSVATADTAIANIKQIESDNNHLFGLFNKINDNSKIMSYVGFDSAKLKKSILDNIARVGDILGESTRVRNDTEIEETKSATAAAKKAAEDAAAARARKAAKDAADLAKKAAEDAAEAAKKLAAAKAAADDKAKADAYKSAVKDLSDLFDAKAAKYNTDISDYLTSITTMNTENADIITNAKKLGTNLETLVKSVLDITTNKPDIGNMKLKQDETEKAIATAVLGTHTTEITKSEDELKLAINGDGTSQGYLAQLKSNVKIIKDDYASFNTVAYTSLSDSDYNTAIEKGLEKIKRNENDLDKLYNDDIVALNIIMTPANVAIKASSDALVAATDSFIKTKDFAVAASKKISDAITQLNTDITNTVNAYNLTPVDRVKGEIDAIVLAIPADAAIAYTNRTAIKTESDAIKTADLQAELNSIRDTVHNEYTKSTNEAHAVNIATINVTSADPVSKLSDLTTALYTVIATYNNITGTIKPVEQIQNVTDKINKLTLLKDIAELMKEIGDKYINTNTLKDETDIIAAQVLAAKNAVDAVARQSADAVAISDNLEQDIIGKIGNISDRNIASELNRIRTKIAEIKRIDDEIRDPGTATNPVPKADAANTTAITSVAAANAELAKFNDNVANNYAKDLTTWLGFSTAVPPTYNDEKDAANLAVAANVHDATTARDNANRANADATNASNDATAKYNRIAPKIQFIRMKITRIEQLIDDINNESDDDTKVQSVTQDDDKVKPFSQNSYDILPLDPKVATLSSNMQFSESKSTATNNPGNSFMYTIVPYDSQELSSDDRVLEIVSFARTQRMPLKDAANIIVKAGELLKKYRGTKKVIPGAWVYRGGKLFSSVKPTKIEELERYIELMRRSLMR